MRNEKNAIREKKWYLDYQARLLQYNLLSICYKCSIHLV